ncbi:ABC transporter permease [Microbacterium sp. R86528]|uniref:ABC transporter permease n=1 Tax=Microbacterium sp. R86528 TaxID=3093864 RepID=UPI0037C770DE
MSTSAHSNGFVAVLRVQLRTGWLSATVWTLAVAGAYVATASAVNGLFGEPDELAAYDATVSENPAMAAINGTPYGADTLGGVVSNEFGFISAIAIPLMGLMLITRQTRAQEEKGMLELLRSRSVGVRVPWLAALLSTTVALILVGTTMAITLVAYGEDAVAALTYGASMAALGLVFAGVAVLAGQLFRRAAGVTTIGLLILGFSYLARAFGDVRDNGWKWLSPLAWQQETRPFTDDLRLWPLLLSLGVAVALVSAGIVLVSHRDLGSALFASRPGPSRASGLLRTTLGTAARVSAPSATGWVAGVFVVAFVFASFTDDVSEILSSNPELEVIGLDPANVNDTFIGFTLFIFTLMIAAMIGQSLSRVRAEEADGFLEPVLARSISRAGWAGANFLVAALAAILALTAGGVGLQLAAGHIVDGIPEAVVSYVPAVLAIVGVTVALFGAVPRGTWVIWLVVGYMAVVGFLGETLEIPDWAMQLSPLHAAEDALTAGVPVETQWALIGITAALTALGMVALRWRDIPR